MIRFYHGRSGQTWPCAARLAGLARQQDRRVFLLVPQQYTLSAERMLMRYLDLPGFFDLDVLSPARLSQRVFGRAGGGGRVRIDAQGKAMAVSRVLMREKERLTFYRSAADREGLRDRVCRLIAEFKRARVTPEALDAYAQSLPQGAQRDKCADLALLYASYEALLSGRFVDGEDVQQELIARLPLSDDMRGAVLIICGFDVLTEELGRIALAQSAVGDAEVILCADPEDEAFSPVTDSVYRFLEKENVHAPLIPIREPAAFPEDLSHLEKNLLARRPAEYAPPPASIRLYAAPTPYAEAYHAAEEIIRLWDSGVPFSDMAVLCGDEDHYFSPLAQVLTACRIPFHLDRKMTAARLGPAAFLVSALRAVAGRYYPSDMIRVIKSGYLPLTREEGFLLENYILGYGIRGGMFQKPFTRGGDQAAQMEELRVRVMAPLEKLREGLKNAQNADESLSAVFSLLEDTGAYDRMNDQAQALAEAGRPEEASQLTQVWKTLMALLDQMHELNGGSRMTGEEAARLLEAGLSGAELSALPQSADSVICGRLGNAALTRPGYLFILGLNDGILAGQDTGLLADEEKAALQDRLRVHLSLDRTGQMQLARLDVYKALTNAGKKLYLSHAQGLQDGTALRPLDLLRTVRGLFPLLAEEGGVTAPQGPAHPVALTPALEGMGAYLRKGAMPGDWEDAWRYISAKHPEDAAALIEAFRRRDPQAPLPEDVTRGLFLERVTSVHRLEAFAVCPLRHFITAGLKPKERKEWTMQSTDTGKFYHSALEGFTRLLPSLPDWPNVTRREVDLLMDAAAQEAVDPQMAGIMEDSARQRSLYKKYRALLSRVAWTFTQTARHSAFRPGQGDSELRFGYEGGGLPAVVLTLSDGSRVFVRGIIDRVERYRSDEGEIFRVLDFKMPDLNLDPEQLYWGTQLQLMIYMNAVTDSLKDGIPGGAYYFHLADPLLPDPGDRADIEKELAKALCLKGITLKDASVIRLMDDGQPPLSMPAGLVKADGEFGKNKLLASLEEMRALMQYVKTAAGRMAEEIMRGRISAEPLSVPGQTDPCERCPVREICRVTAPDSVVRPREAGKETFDEIMEKVMRGETPAFFPGPASPG